MVASRAHEQHAGSSPPPSPARCGCSRPRPRSPPSPSARARRAVGGVPARPPETQPRCDRNRWTSLRPTPAPTPTERRAPAVRALAARRSSGSAAAARTPHSGGPRREKEAAPEPRRPAVAAETPDELIARAYALATEAAECDKYLHVQRHEGISVMTGTHDHDLSGSPDASSRPTSSSYADIGERVAGVLAAAETAANHIREDARGSAEEILSIAREEADALRADAAAYDADTRAAVESYASDRRREVDAGGREAARRQRDPSPRDAPGGRGDGAPDRGGRQAAWSGASRRVPSGGGAAEEGGAGPPSHDHRDRASCSERPRSTASRSRTRSGRTHSGRSCRSRRRRPTTASAALDSTRVL